MCDLCDENGPASCQDCGRLICFDIEGGDDVMRLAYVTSGGDLFCDRCGERHDAGDDADDYDDVLAYGPDPVRPEEEGK